MPEYTKYSFKGNEYTKRRLVLAIVKQYVQDLNPTFSEICEAFPSSLQGGAGVIISAEELAERKRNSTDTIERFFTGDNESLQTSDGTTIYVSNQWGTKDDGEGTFDRFIKRAKELGFEITSVENGSKTIKELFEEYKANPRSEWIANYKARCQQLAQYKDKSPDDYDEQLLIDIWKNHSNGIANVSPGFLSNEEFNNLLPDLPELTSKIVQDPSLETLEYVYAWAKNAKKEGKLKRIKWGVIHRVFAAASPTEYSTILNQFDVRFLANELNKSFNLDIDLGEKEEWGTPQVSLMRALKSEGLEDEDVFLVNTFAWRLYQLFAQEENQANSYTDKESEVKGNVESCMNVIYYGPPGTGKTHKLQEILKDEYTDYEEVQDRKLWLITHLEVLSWFEIIVIIMLDFSESRNVSDIVSLI